MYKSNVSECTSLDETEFPNMFIPALPADEKEVLKVQCFGGTVQLGSETVTCDKDRTFTYDSDTKPECRKLGKAVKILLILVSLDFHDVCKVKRPG